MITSKSKIIALVSPESLQRRLRKCAENVGRLFSQFSFIYALKIMQLCWSQSVRNFDFLKMQSVMKSSISTADRTNYFVNKLALQAQDPKHRTHLQQRLVVSR